MKWEQLILEMLAHGPSCVEPHGNGDLSWDHRDLQHQNIWFLASKAQNKSSAAEVVILRHKVFISCVGGASW